MTKISVIIPTLHRPRLLYNCLEKLILQNMPAEDYEIIIVLDGPDKLTKIEIHQFKERYKEIPPLMLYEMPFRKGPGAARNFGWKKAKGTMIAFTDDDCLPPTNWLRKSWEAYENNKSPVLAGKVIVPIDENPTDFARNTARLEQAGLLTANCFCTRESLEKVRGFDERFSMAWREDSDLEFNFLVHQIPVNYREDISVTHPVRKAGWGISLRDQKKSQFNALLYKKYPALYREKIQASPPWHYYTTVIAFFLWVCSLVFSQVSATTVLFFIFWLTQYVSFTLRRLSGNSRHPAHIAEMWVTSLFIPFLSVYWRLSGAIKYKTWFL